ncbi:MAG: autotransporter domain-containing protein [Gammaproteobacteria bacterium]|nr:autotransporter domain-containing protein [Gammaproteobacteria bacterium]
MRSRYRTIGGLLACTLAIPTGLVGAAEFSNTIFFGDSLSDSGAFSALLPAGTGRFTTNPGPVWSEVFASHYGLTATPANAGGTNYAQGGARVNELPGVPSTPPTGTATPLSGQVTSYLTGSVDPKAFHAVWSGANDIFHQAGLANASLITPAQVQVNVITAASIEVAQIGRLASAGARYILVPNMPNIGTTPFGAASGAAATFTSLSNLYTTTLFSGLDAAGIPVIPLDVDGLLREAIANPASVGLANATLPACGTTPSLLCTSANFVVPNAQQTFLFADGVHPTTATHQLVADYAVSVIEGPQAWSMLAEAPVRIRDGLIAALDTRLARAPDPAQRVRAFVLTDYNPNDIDAGATGPGLQGKVLSLVAGADVTLGNGIVIGAALSRHLLDADLGDERNGFDFSETAFSAFGSYHLGGGYVRVFGTVSDINFSDLSRVVSLGSTVRTLTAATGGRNYSLAASGGWDFSHGALVHGPVLGLARQWIEVNGFTEQGGGITALRLEAQQRDALIGRAGYRAQYDLGDFTPYAQAAIEHDFDADPRDVGAALVSFPTDPYRLPAYVPDDTYASVVAGTSVRMSQRITGNIQYRGLFGQRAIDSHAVSLNVDFAF